MRVEVWAPRARQVELDRGDARLPMRSGRDGWWSIEDAALIPGVRYGFRLDGGEPLPDPRSRSQPAGPHGPSELVEPAEAFAWSDQGWTGAELATAVLYELHIGTFSAAGTFDGAIEHLDHLVQLGVTAVELLPVAEFPGERGWGYDGVDLWAPHHAYGGPGGLRRLVDACHRRGLAVVLDVVYNHLGPDGNHLPRYGPYFTAKHHTPWGAALNYDDAGSDAVRAYVIEGALMWLRDYHIDGLRLDAVHAIVDTSALHLLEELAQRVGELEKSSGRRRWLIAESDLNDPRLVRTPVQGGFGLTAQWADEFHHALHAVLTGEREGYYRDFGRLEDLAIAWRQAYVYARRYSEHRGRTFGRAPDGVPGERFVVFLQNHDQIGNRARGDRIGSLTDTGGLRIGTAITLLSPFVPLLFQGEEWAASSPFQYFTDHQDPALGAAVSSGRRAEFASFGWRPEDVPDPQEVGTFERSKLRWEERRRDGHADQLEWVRQLLALRRQLGAHAGRREEASATVDQERGRLVLRRPGLLLACNLSQAPATLAETAAAVPTGPVLSSAPGARWDGNRLDLPARSVAVWRTAG